MPSVMVPADPAIGFPIEQLTICRQLAKAYPHLSITIFSGRFQGFFICREISF